MHNPAEDVTVEVLTEGVTGLIGLVNGQRTLDQVPSELLPFSRQGLYNDRKVDADESCRHCYEVLAIGRGSWRFISVNLAEFDITHVEHGDDAVQDLCDLLIGEVHISHTLQCKFELRYIINVRYRLHFGLVHVVVVIYVQQAILGHELFHEGRLVSPGHLRCLEHLVENMEVALDSVLEADAGLFEQVVDNRC